MFDQSLAKPIRNKTSVDLARAFKVAFAHILGTRTEPPCSISATLSDATLCDFYDNLNRTQKRGLWPEISRQIGKEDKWAAKHYFNSFKRAQFPNPITDQVKREITNQVR